jgi:ribose 5-phosphate isomerase B
MSIKIAIGADHAGFELKQHLIEYLNKANHIVLDKGCYSNERADYADYGHLVANALISNEVTFGILMCGSGNGINMTANKHNGIRAALCWNDEIAALARQHNDANILVLPARYVSVDEARKCVNAFLTEQFEGGRHLQRIHKIDI